MKVSQKRQFLLLLGLLLVTSACSSRPNLPAALPTATTSSTTAPAVEQPAGHTAPANQGLVVFDKAAGEFVGYTTDGQQTFRSPAPGIEYAIASQISVMDGVVYYMSDREKQVFRSTPEGVEKLDLPTDANLSGFKVSRDEQWIAWTLFVGDANRPYSDLWVARLEGLTAKDAKQLVRYSPDLSGEVRIDPAFNMVIVEWTADGKLLFERGVTGLGGYILYGGHNSLYRYDPANGQIATIVPAEENHGICLDSYRLDLNRVAFNCNQEGPGIILRNIQDGSETALPKLSGQGVAGSVQYSPSGAWVAYAIAEGNPENEKGQVVVVPADMSANPVAIASVDGNTYPYVLGWLDEQTIVFSRNQWPNMSIWTLSRDGSRTKQLVEGMFVGFIQ